MMQGTELPIFDNPPVIETVLGAQFDPIPEFTVAHFGWYWREYLDKTWSKTNSEPGLADQFERFGASDTPLHQFTAIIGALRPERVQFINADDDRVIQLQKSRFIYNWRRRAGSYPTFGSLYPEFNDRFGRFRDFLREAGLSDLSLNQWEVTYINYLPKGDLWETPEDWHRILPGLIPAPRNADESTLESESGELHFEIVPHRGRLHVSIGHGRSHAGGEELLAVHLTARGPVTPSKPGWDLGAGLELGHRVLVQTFANLASDSALRHWGMRRS
jgi:uncharacterized protein (TIGR04255 family)